MTTDTKQRDDALEVLRSIAAGLEYLGSTSSWSESVVEEMYEAIAVLEVYEGVPKNDELVYEEEEDELMQTYSEYEDVGLP